MKKNKILIKDVFLIACLAVCLLLICLCFQGIMFGPKVMLEKQVSAIWIIIVEINFLALGLWIYFLFIKTCRYLSRYNKYGLMGNSFL